MRWALIGLTALSVSEAIVIAALLYARPAPDRGAPPAVEATKNATLPGTVTLSASAPKPETPPPPPAPSSASLSRLEIGSEPEGARVLVDNVALGVTPLSVPVSPGEHTIVISGGGSTTRRTVNVEAGVTSALMATLAPAGATGGWVSIDVPLDLQVSEGGSLLGTTKAARIMLPAGRHQLQLSNAALAFQQIVSVDIQPGKTVTTKVTLPNGSLSLNALPWANVWLDGQSLGTTPFANLAVPIGSHEVIWRHPQLGERRESIVVTAKTPVRRVMDLNKQ